MPTLPNSANTADKHEFTLFVSGMSVKSVRAVENLRRICDQYIPDNYEIKIIDISRDKEQASAHQIVAIPTLIKTYPAPKKIILGDLSDNEKVIRILNLNE